MLISKVKAILKAMTKMFFGTKLWSGQTFFYIEWEVFPMRENALGLTAWTLSYALFDSMFAERCGPHCGAWLWRLVFIQKTGI